MELTDELFPRTNTAPNDLALGFPGDEMQATPTLDLAPVEPPPEPPAPVPLEPLPEEIKTLTAEPKKKSSTREYLDTLSSGEYFGLALQEIGFALQGKPGPMRGMVDADRKFKLEQLAENRAAVETIGKGLSYVRGLPPGPQRDAAIKAFSVAIPAKMRESFEMLSKREDVLANYGLIDGDLRVKAVAHGMCSTSGDYSKCMTEFVTDSNKAKALAKAVDDPALPDIERKLSAISALPEIKTALEKMKDAGKFPTLVDLFDKQKKILPPELQLSRDDFLTLRRNPDVLPKFGMYTNEMITKQVEKRAEKTIERAVAGPKKDVEDKRAQIQLKISRGETVSETERAFLDELNKSDPFNRILTERAEGGKAAPSKPAKAAMPIDQWLKEARKVPKNKDFTDDQLRQFYNEKYGKK